MNNNGEILKALIEVSHVEFQTYDLHSKHLVFTSGIAEKILGYTHEQYEALSKNYYEQLIHPGDHGKMHDTIQKLLTSAPGEIVETTMRYKKAMVATCGYIPVKWCTNAMLITNHQLL